MRPVFLLLSLLFSSSLWAESGTYRIELIVFQHLGSESATLETETLRDFASAFPLDAAGLTNDPDDPVALKVTSDQMQAVWRRLEGSADYRPIKFLSWEQSRIDFHPPIRVHDDERVFEQVEVVEMLDLTDLLTAESGIEYVRPYFRLDGTAQLRRSRFLHLDLDLEYREDMVRLGRPLPTSAEEARKFTESAQVNAEPLPGPVFVHALKQSRQIRTGDMQYFDTPYLGVLARITATAGE